MPHYYLHLRNGAAETLDPEGTEMAAESVAAMALLGARDCMAGDVKGGRLDLRYRVDVHDDDGGLVHSLLFTNALEIIPAD